MPGITRININENTMGWRMDIAREHEPCLNAIYREIFPTLADGDEVIHVEKDSVMARYDHLEGIDVILSHGEGMKMTLQEKLLTWHEDTVTVELRKNSGKNGAWFYCTAQLYFVGYNRKYKAGATNNVLSLDNWILVDFAMLKIETLNRNVPWEVKQNQRDNRRATFQCVHFDHIPKNCVIARKNDIPKNLFGF